MTCHEKEQDVRQELRQSYQPEIEGTASDLVNLPPNRDRLHFEPRHDKKSLDLKK
jgi:hypothetical protein